MDTSGDREKFIVKCFGRNETGDSELLYSLKQDQYIYDVDEARWYTHNGQFWIEAKTNPIGHIIETEVAGQYAWLSKQFLERSQSPKDDNFKRFMEYRQRAYDLRSNGKINAVIKRAQENKNFIITTDKWSIDPYELPVKNGIISLKTGELRQAKPSDFIRFPGPTEYKGLNEPAPRFERFIMEIFDNDKDKADYVQRLLGYSLTGDVQEKIMPIFTGTNDNGKDTLFRAIKSVLGDVAGDVGKDALIASKKGDRAANPSTYSLRFKRIAYVNETNDGARLDAGQVKYITGGGELTARELYGNPVSWKPQHTIFLMTNFKPSANSEDEALWSRIAVIEFPLSFVHDPKLEHERQIEKGLDQKLQNEASGILAWLVRGCLAWQNEGLNPPASVLAATAEYRDSEDILGEFLNEEMELSPANSIKANDLYKEYKKWASDNGYMPVSRTRLGKKLKNRFEDRRKADGIYYIGIGYRTSTPEYDWLNTQAMESRPIILAMKKQGVDVEIIHKVIQAQYPKAGFNLIDIQEME